MPHALKVSLQLIACLSWLVVCANARSHPIVNTDINRHVTLTPGPTGVGVHYIYEMLEIAAVNVGRRADKDGDGSISDTERDEYARAWGQELLAAMRMSLGGQPVALSLRSVAWTLGPAPFGLHTWTLTADLLGSWPAGTREGVFLYEDGHRPGESGWKEVVLLPGPKIRVRDANAAAEDRSARLTNYKAMAEMPNPEQLAVKAKLSIVTASVTAADELSSRPRTVRESSVTAVPAGGQNGAVQQTTAPDQPQATAATARAAESKAATTTAAEHSNGAPTLKTESATPTPAPAASPMSSSVVTQVATSGVTPMATPVVTPMATADTARLRAPEASAWRHYIEPFFRLGMHHIATGWDHLAFLLGLLLFRQTLKQLAWVVTAFTLAHSLTLGLAAIGWVRPPGAAVEALIAVSIAYVGAMALWKPQLRHGPWIAMGFGLIHGFGFAGALGETLGEVDASGWLVALASFNLGIEFLQLLLVAAAFGLLAWSDRLTSSRRPRMALATVVLASGIWWTLERTVLA